METIDSIRPLLAILASVLVIPLIIFARGSPNLREMWTLTGAALKFLIVASMLPLVLAGTQIEFTLAEVLPGFADGPRFGIEQLDPRPLILLFRLPATPMQNRYGVLEAFAGIVAFIRACVTVGAALIRRLVTGAPLENEFADLGSLEEDLAPERLITRKQGHKP